MARRPGLGLGDPGRRRVRRAVGGGRRRAGRDGRPASRSGRSGSPTSRSGCARSSTECDEERAGVPARSPTRTRRPSTGVMAAYRLPSATEADERHVRLRRCRRRSRAPRRCRSMVARRAVYADGPGRGGDSRSGNPNAACDGLSGAAALLHAATLSRARERRHQRVRVHRRRRVARSCSTTAGARCGTAHSRSCATSSEAFVIAAARPEPRGCAAGPGRARLRACGSTPSSSTAATRPRSRASGPRRSAGTVAPYDEEELARLAAQRDRRPRGRSRA